MVFYCQLNIGCGKGSYRLQKISPGKGETAYLQRELGEVLTSALANIVQLRPADPINFIATWLRKYREVNPLSETAFSSPDVAKMDKNKKSKSSKGSSKTPPVCSSLHKAQNSVDDSTEIVTSNLESNPQSDTPVHGDIIRDFDLIGDLFDDDDLR